jgi:hypothetical protein
MRKNGLIGGYIGHLMILSEDLMQIGGPAPPMTDDENRVLMIF